VLSIDDSVGLQQILNEIITSANCYSGSIYPSENEVMNIAHRRKSFRVGNLQYLIKAYTFTTNLS